MSDIFTVPSPFHAASGGSSLRMQPLVDELEDYTPVYVKLPNQILDGSGIPQDGNGGYARVGAVDYHAVRDITACQCIGPWVPTWGPAYVPAESQPCR